MKKTLKELTIKDNFMFGAVMSDEDNCKRLLELVKFLEYVKADLSDSTKDFKDDFVKQLQISVQNIKKNRKMEENFMLLSDMLRKERKEGRIEGKAEGKTESIIMLLEELGEVSEELKQKIEKESNEELLIVWLKLAAKSQSVEQFQEEM